MRRVASIASPTSVTAVAMPAQSPRASLLADLKLFGLTYAAGFLFVSLFLA